MRPANAFKSIASRRAAEMTHWIPAQERERMCLAEFVPQLLQANRSFLFSFPPKQRYHLAERADFPVFAVGHVVYQPANDLLKTIRIRQAADHQPRQCLRSVKCNIQP